jgi:hypothetical protein
MLGVAMITPPSPTDLAALREMLERAPYHTDELVLLDGSIESKVDYFIVRTFGVFWEERLRFFHALLRAAPALLAEIEELRARETKHLQTGLQMLEWLENEALSAMGDYGTVNIGKGAVRAIGKLRGVVDAAVAWRKSDKDPSALHSGRPLLDALADAVDEYTGQQGRK